MQPQNPPKPSFFWAIFHKLSPLCTVTLESFGAVGATGAVVAMLIGVPGRMCSGLTMPGLMAASSCQRWPSPKFICASFHNESPYFTMMLRGPAAFEIAGATSVGCVGGATNPGAGNETTSGLANTGATGISRTTDAGMFGFETANMVFAAIVREMETASAAVARLGVGAGTIGVGSTSRVFNLGAFKSEVGKSGAAGALWVVGSTAFGLAATNSGFAYANIAFVTGRW